MEPDIVVFLFIPAHDFLLPNRPYLSIKPDYGISK